MNSVLSEQLRQDFFIRLYFDISNGFEMAGIKRAFLDFSRTLKIKDNKRANLKNDAENYPAPLDMDTKWYLLVQICNLHHLTKDL